MKCEGVCTCVAPFLYVEVVFLNSYVSWSIRLTSAWGRSRKGKSARGSRGRVGWGGFAYRMHAGGRREDRIDEQGWPHPLSFLANF